MEKIIDRCEHITDKAQLVDYFLKSCKKRSDFKIGVEVERPGVIAQTGYAATYSGEKGVAAFLNRFNANDNYKIIQENGHILGLKTEYGDLTLEPGSQLELSAVPITQINELASILWDYDKKCAAIGEDLGIKWLAYGIQPLSTFDNIEIIPKNRYDIMSSYLPKKGKKSLVMMKETSGIQASIDFESEEDAMKKLRVSLGLSPIITAMFTNSPVRGGELSGYKSFRASSWLDTDNDRCGLVSRKIFEQDFGFDDYVEVLLDVPMFFVKKDNRLVDMTHMTFRQYMKQYPATMCDWLLHKTTFFPDVRLKNILEIRNCDCQDSELILAFSALIKGIFYNDSAMDAAWELVKDLSWEQRSELRESVPIKGLSEVADTAAELLSIASESLGGESIYLEKLKELVSRKVSPADIIIKNWDTAWKKDLNHLIEHTSLKI